MNLTYKNKSSNYKIAAGILILTHLVGVIGFTTRWQELFLTITPFHLLLVFALLVIFQENKSMAFYRFMGIVFVSSYLVELVGVQTGIIFGNYSYGTALGFKVGDTPLLIGLLWFMLIQSIGVMLSGWKMNDYLKSLIGGIFMVGIDLLIEPVAMKLGFWSWEGNLIPLQNYLAWFIISFLFFMLFNKQAFKKKNKLAPYVYWLQAAFFAVINLV